MADSPLRTRDPQVVPPPTARGRTIARLVARAVYETPTRTSARPVRPTGPSIPAPRRPRACGSRKIVSAVPNLPGLSPSACSFRKISRGGDDFPGTARSGSAPRQPRQRAAQRPSAGLQADLGQLSRGLNRGAQRAGVLGRRGLGSTTRGGPRLGGGRPALGRRGLRLCRGWLGLCRRWLGRPCRRWLGRPCRRWPGLRRCGLCRCGLCGCGLRLGLRRLGLRGLRWRPRGHGSLGGRLGVGSPGAAPVRAGAGQAAEDSGWGLVTHRPTSSRTALSGASRPAGEPIPR